MLLLAALLGPLRRAQLLFAHNLLNLVEIVNVPVGDLSPGLVFGIEVIERFLGHLNIVLERLVGIDKLAQLPGLLNVVVENFRVVLVALLRQKVLDFFAQLAVQPVLDRFQLAKAERLEVLVRGLADEVEDAALALLLHAGVPDLHVDLMQDAGKLFKVLGLEVVELHRVQAELLEDLHGFLWGQARIGTLVLHDGVEPDIDLVVPDEVLVILVAAVLAHKGVPLHGLLQLRELLWRELFDHLEPLLRDEHRKAIPLDVSVGFEGFPVVDQQRDVLRGYHPKN